MCPSGRTLEMYHPLFNILFNFHRSMSINDLKYAIPRDVVYTTSRGIAYLRIAYDIVSRAIKLISPRLSYDNLYLSFHIPACFCLFIQTEKNISLLSRNRRTGTKEFQVGTFNTFNCAKYLKNLPLQSVT